MKNKGYYRNYARQNLIFCAALVLLLFLVWIWLIIDIGDLVRYRNDPEIRQAEKEQKLADIQTYPVYKRRFFQGAFWLCVLLASGGIVGYLMKNWGEVQQKLVFPFKFGENEVPVRKKDLALASTIAMGLTSAAQVRELNAGLISGAQIASDIYRTIGKSTNYHIQQMVGTPEQKSLPEAPQKNTPTFQELLVHGEVARNKPMILCYQNGQPHFGSFLDIYSTGIAGESGSGKTTTQLFLIGSGLLCHQAKVYEIDPHFPHPKSLGAKTRPLWESGLIKKATWKDEILDVVQEVEMILERRLKQEDTDETPVLLIIDEIAMLSRTSFFTPIAHCMERIAQEGRKCHIFEMLSSQVWLAEIIGKNSALRDSLTSAYVHKIKPKQANLLLQNKDATDLVKQIRKPGKVVFCPVFDPPTLCDIPLTTEEDMQTVARMLSGENFHKASVTNTFEQPVTSYEQNVTETSHEKKILVPEMILTPEFCRTQREKFGLSLRDVAEKIGCHHNKIYRYEKGEADLSDDEKKLLWAVLTQAGSQRGNTVTPGYL